MYLLRGVEVFLPHLTEGTKNGELAPLLKHGGQSWNQVHAAVLSENALVKQHLDHVRFLIKETVIDDASTQKIYLGAIATLEKIFALYLHADSHNRIGQIDISMAFLWLFEATDGLLPLLRVPKQEAVVLMAFFAALLHRTPEHPWWMQSWPEHLIAKIYALLDEEHRLWIRWPIEEMGWVPPP